MFWTIFWVVVIWKFFANVERIEREANEQELDRRIEQEGKERDELARKLFGLGE